MTEQSNKSGAKGSTGKLAMGYWGTAKLVVWVPLPEQQETGSSYTRKYAFNRSSTLDGGAPDVAWENEKSTEWQRLVLGGNWVIFNFLQVSIVVLLWENWIFLSSEYQMLYYSGTFEYSSFPEYQSLVFLRIEIIHRWSISFNIPGSINIPPLKHSMFRRVIIPPLKHYIIIFQRWIIQKG